MVSNRLFAEAIYDAEHDYPELVYLVHWRYLVQREIEFRQLRK